MGNQTMIGLSLYFYGEPAADFVAREERKFQALMKATFPGS